MTHASSAAYRDDSQRTLSADTFEKVHKVLALVQSDHVGEAESALRHAQALLDRAGLSLETLVHALIKNEAVDGESQADLSGRERDLQRKVTMLTWENRWRTERMVAATARIQALEDDLAHVRAEAERWHAIARETVESLWDHVHAFVCLGETVNEETGNQSKVISS